MAEPANVTALATAPAKSKSEQFMAQVLPPDRKSELRRSLPAHVSPERFERNLFNAVMQNPALMNYAPGLVFREVSKAAALGLYLDPQLGEAYIIEGYDGKLKAKAPQLRIGYRGVMKLARQSEEVATIYAHEVCQNDEIECVLGDQKRLNHKPTLFADRGPVIGFYSVVKYKDGTTDFEPMTRAQIDAIRARSDGYKAFQNGLIKSTPWSTDYDEMAKKTAIRRLMKRCPQSPELASAWQYENGAEGDGGMVDVTPETPAIASPADLDGALAAETPAVVEAEAPAVDLTALRDAARPWFKKFKDATTQAAVDELLADPDWQALNTELAEHDPETLGKIAKHFTKEA
jgi:recombination protein RecT